MYLAFEEDGMNNYPLKILFISNFLQRFDSLLEDQNKVGRYEK